MAECVCQPSAESEAKTQIKHDWYQTETTVVITVLIRNIKEENLKTKFTESTVSIDVKIPEETDVSATFQLSHKIDPNQCSYKITPSKIELKLKKLEGIRWAKLEGELEENFPKLIPQEVSQLSGPPPYPTSMKGKDWSAVEKDIIAEEAKEKPVGEEALNSLFQDIYGKGSDEVKKAMIKSYMESGGTVLSTNWNEIAQEKVPIKPPDGMEFKKW